MAEKAKISAKRKMSVNLSREYKSEYEQYDMCHHCRFLLPKESLVTCNYRSSMHGRPFFNLNNTDPLGFSK